jgi:hypothetical protein
MAAMSQATEVTQDDASAEADRPATDPSVTDARNVRSNVGGRSSTSPSAGAPLGGVLPFSGGTVSVPPPAPLIASSFCASTVRDQSAPGNCVEASSTPVLGKLYPLSTNLFVNGTGRVGMGTTTPLAKLDLVCGADGDGYNDPIAVALEHRLGGYRHFIRTRHDAAAGSPANAIDFYLNDSAAAAGSSQPGVGNVGAMTINASTANRLQVSGGIEVDCAAVSTGSYLGPMLRFGEPTSGEGILSKRTAGTNQWGLELVTSGTSRMAVTNGGNVGIGTLTPDTTLHVHKGSAGTVTADANSALVVENSTHAYVSILTPDASERGILFGEPSGNATGAILYNTPAALDGFVFRTNGGNNRMAIRDNGFVGIGTTVPTERLDVKIGRASCRERVS